jgi:predicted ester cyclase
MTSSILSMKLNRKLSPAFSPIILAGMIFVAAATLLLLSPFSIKAQEPMNNITNQQSNGQEEEINKAIIVAFTEAFNDRNYTAIEQYVAENITEHRAGVQSGRNSTIGFLQSLASAFPDFQTSIDHMVAEGDRVVVFTTTNGTHQGEFIFAPGVPPSGREISFKTADMYRISNGQLVEHWDVIEILDMLTAIGAITFSQPSLPTSFNGTNTNNDGIPQQ